MPLLRPIEIGRMVMVNYGPLYGRIYCVVDIVDQNRVLVDAPGETRHLMPLSRLTPTRLKIDIHRMANKKLLSAKMFSTDIVNKLSSDTHGKKIRARERDSAMTDFLRFKNHIFRVETARKL